MSNLYTHSDANIRKTWGLMVLFVLLVGAVGYAISYIYGNIGILYVAVVFALIMNFFSFWYSDKIVLSLHRAKPVTRGEFFDLWNITENLSITAGLPMPKLCVISDPAPNAFATGRDAEHAVVCVTTGLLALLNKEELEGVIAHELSHIGNKDMLIATVAVVLAGFLSILADLFVRSSWSGGRDNNRGGGVLAILGLILVVLAPIFATLIRLSLSRKREFLADASGALLTRYPEGLANALKKISVHSAPLATRHDATSHLFISNPFGHKKTPFLHKLFMTHPPVEERVKALLGS